jgi:uncharacterized protein (TIGR02466 family)
MVACDCIIVYPSWIVPTVLTRLDCMFKTQMLAGDGTLQRHWPVPMAVHHFAQGAQFNPALANAFRAIRAADPKYSPGGLYASSDDLLRRIEIPEFAALVKFIVASLNATAQEANASAWPAGRHGLELELMGVWFQIQNGDAFHDVHTHGNCSWSGVYYVQLDTPEQRSTHPRLGALNGATRFYSPLSMVQGGAYVDRGNAWMQQSTLDVMPKEGDLVLFPSFLPHKAMPYSGERDRIIVSFNAQIRAPGGDDLLLRYAGV